jgi:IPT/TIG domain
MKEAHTGRGLRAILALLAVGVVATAFSAAGGTSARAAVSKTCAKVAAGKSHFSGVISAVPVGAGCVNVGDDRANFDPPLIWHGGPVMGTNSTGPIVVTPIFWHNAGHPMSTQYENIITRYLGDVAHDSGRHTNVFSTLTQYFGTDGFVNYQVREGAPIQDTNALPASSCILNHKDRSNIYADGSGYDACISDPQVQAETASVVAAHHLPVNFSHIYVLFIPKHVETCFMAGSTSTIRKLNQACTINHEKTVGYCAYHFITPSKMIYANLSYPIYGSQTGYTCSSDGNFPVVQKPNGNADADTEVSPTSHEIMEAITDPDASTGWYDAIGQENGDECAYLFGPTHGTAGAFYNQVINGHHYLTQEEFSNRDFAATNGGCLQSEAQPAPTLTSVGPKTGTHLGGTRVTVKGTNFAGATSVTFGGTPGTAVVVSDNGKILVTTPAHATGVVDVQVTTSTGTTAVVTADHFTYN